MLPAVRSRALLLQARLVCALRAFPPTRGYADAFASDRARQLIELAIRRYSYLDDNMLNAVLSALAIYVIQEVMDAEERSDA